MILRRQKNGLYQKNNKLDENAKKVDGKNKPEIKDTLREGSKWMWRKI